MVRVFARAKYKPGKADDLRAVLQRLVKTSRLETGVLRYDLFESAATGEFLFHEEYAGENEFEAHRNSRHVLVAIGRSTPLMEGELTLWIVEPVL